MTNKEIKKITKEEISWRIREGVKVVIEQVLEEDMTEHIGAAYRERIYPSAWRTQWTLYPQPHHSSGENRTTSGSSGPRVVDLALLIVVGVNEEGYREVLAVEHAGGEKKGGLAEFSSMF